MGIKKTDIGLKHLIPEHLIFVSKDYYYGKQRSKINFLVEILTIIKKHKVLKFNPFLVFRYGDLGQPMYNGFYYTNENFLELKYQHDRVNFLTTLCHELVHAEQEFTGKTLADNEWKGKIYKTKETYDISNPKECDEYFNLPWEKEAYRREDELACEVMGLMKAK